ncbi:MAG: xylose isormerase domain protein, barrel [Deltaproteobacteria bacterium]|nr:xylose isormerase domain protein, barrel [Deltaproteobacteria bacterium]
MLFGFSTYFLTNDALGPTLDAIVASGFKAIELSYEPPHLFDFNDGLIEKVDRLRNDGVVFSMHGPFLETNLGSYLDEILRLSRDRVIACLKLCARLGADPIVVHPGYSFFRKLKEFDAALRNRFLGQLKDIADEARDLGVRIALENVFMSYFYFQHLDEFNDIVKAVPGIGVTLDIGHAYISKRMAKDPKPEESILEDVRRMGVENLFHLHLHNNDGTRDDHDFINGSMDMGKVLRGIKELGYTGKVVIETLDAERMGFGPVIEKLEQIKP